MTFITDCNMWNRSRMPCLGRCLPKRCKIEMCNVTPGWSFSPKCHPNVEKTGEYHGSTVQFLCVILCASRGPKFRNLRQSTSAKYYIHLLDGFQVLLLCSCNESACELCLSLWTDKWFSIRCFMNSKHCRANTIQG